MITTRVETTIARPVNEVWTVAADTLRHPQWMTVETAERLHGDGSRTGDRGRERMRMGPFTYNAEFEVVAADPGQRIVWRAGAGSPFEGDLSLELEPLGPSMTRASYGLSFQMRGLLRLLEPLMKGEAQQGPTRELRRLKALVESGGTRPANG